MITRRDLLRLLFLLLLPSLLFAELTEMHFRSGSVKSVQFVDSADCDISINVGSKLLKMNKEKINFLVFPSGDTVHYEKYECIVPEKMSSVSISTPCTTESDIKTFYSSDFEKGFTKLGSINLSEDDNSYSYRKRGIITLFYKGESETIHSDISCTPFSVLSNNNVNHVSYHCDIEYGSADIIPANVDSVHFDNMTIFPNTSAFYHLWMFPLRSGRIQLFSGHPRKSWEVSYRDSVHTFHTLTNDITEFIYANQLARSPRLLCHFKISPQKAIEEFNKMPDSLLIPTSSPIKNSFATISIFESSAEKVTYDLLDTLIGKDSLNSVALLKKAAKLTIDSNFVEAGELISKAERITPFQDYYLFYVKGFWYEYYGDTKEAINHYYKAMRELSYYRNSRKLSSLNRKIERQIKKIQD